MKHQSPQVYIQNKKARYEYEYLQTFQAGMVLSGKIVNYIRNKQLQLSGKYIVYQKNQLHIIGLTVDKEQFNIPLLVTAKELKKIVGTIQEKGKSCIPLKIYRSGRWIKCEIALVTGRNKASKKEYLKEKDIKREMRQEIG